MAPIDISNKPIEEIIQTLIQSKPGSRFTYYRGQIICENLKLKIAGNPILSIAIRRLQEEGKIVAHQCRTNLSKGQRGFQYIAIRQ